MKQDKTIVVRPSRESDVDAMLAIYRRHIHRGVEAGVDDSDTPQPDDLRERRKNLKDRRFPHVVAIEGEKVVGYAYVVLFRKRPAYRYTVKHSIYVHHDHSRLRHRSPPAETERVAASRAYVDNGELVPSAATKTRAYLVRGIAASLKPSTKSTTLDEDISQGLRAIFVPEST